MTRALVARLARYLPILRASLIFQGQPGKRLTSPAPCPYRRRRTLKRNRPHLRDRKRWIFIPLSLENRGGLFPRGILDNKGIAHRTRQKRNVPPLLCTYGEGA